jgi:hypothetical protein
MNVLKMPLSVCLETALILEAVLLVTVEQGINLLLMEVVVKIMMNVRMKRLMPVNMDTVSIQLVRSHASVSLDSSCTVTRGNVQTSTNAKQWACALTVCART